ncbi:MAG: 6-O-methylguanine DNA methyltransferase [Methanobacteriota archaeon]|nr:MAG: 6-O-methylguanine DNA methyltransferase [Euryarchaeota archaeon]
MKGTPFQVKVWNELKKIPRGEVRTYKEIAIKIGKPKAARAVANACALNPNPIIVPCHRVIKSNGELGGYSGPGGIKQKKELLENEGLSI